MFYSPGGFWAPLFLLFDHLIEARLLAPEFNDSWRAVDRIEDVLPALFDMATPPDEVADKVTVKLA